MSFSLQLLRRPSRNPASGGSIKAFILFLALSTVEKEIQEKVDWHLVQFPENKEG